MSLAARGWAFSASEPSPAPDAQAPAPLEIIEPERPPDDAPSGSCDVSLFSDDMPDTCRTPRSGTLSGGYVALDVGFFQARSQTEREVGIGAGPSINFRLGFELWDTVLLTTGISALFPSDQRPVSETVVDCTRDVTGFEQCASSAHAQQSEIKGGEAAIFEAGVQHRFRPWISSSLSPGVMLGYAAAFRSLKRGVDCDGCGSSDLHVSVSGAYVAPFFRVTFGHKGMYAAVVRSAWFLSGDMLHSTTLGFEWFMP